MTKTILLVEDNELNLKLFHDVLEARGHRIVMSDTGRDALKLARLHDVDIVLMDMKLPGISGVELTERFKAQDDLRHIPVVALTGAVMDSDRRAFEAAGCDGFIEKPVKIMEFGETVEAYIDTGAQRLAS